MSHPQDGEWQVTINYQVTSGGRVLPHRHTFDIQRADTPTTGEPFTDVIVNTKGGATHTLLLGLTNYVPHVQKQFSNNMTIGIIELHRLVSGMPPEWYGATDEFIGDVGTGSGSVAIGYQQLFTYRTMGGKILKLQFLEGNVGNNERVITPSGLNQTDFNDFVIGDDGFIVGRDDTFPLALVSYANTQNERVARKRWRSF